jgi:membrane protein implicated in regulation of membrane protease activity
MRKISPAWKGLYEGYLDVGKAQRQLELAWTRAIQVAEKRIHRRQHQEWSAKVASQLRILRLMKIIGLIVFLLVCSCAVISSILPFGFVSWGMAIFISLVLLGVVIAQTASVENLEKKPPVRQAAGRNLLDITALWWARLEPPPVEIKVDGDIGEKALLDALEKRLSNQYIALHQYMVLRNLDADVILLGPTGIWLLESKYHSGKVICRNGDWSQEKSYHGPGGIPQIESQNWKPYDEQWLSEKGSIVQTLQRRLPREMQWVANEIRGGLAFTHKKVTLDIDASCRVEYGTIAYWLKKIGSSPAVPKLTTEIALCIVDALLEYANQIAAEASDRSAKQLAAELYQAAESEIPAFVRANL